MSAGWRQHHGARRGGCRNMSLGASKRVRGGRVFTSLQGPTLFNVIAIASAARRPRSLKAQLYESQQDHPYLGFGWRRSPQ